MAKSRENTSKKKSLVRRGSLASDLIMLVAQIGAIAPGVVVVFSFVFGIMRVTDPSTEPRFQDGDLVMFYRVGKRYEARDVVVFVLGDNCDEAVGSRIVGCVPVDQTMGKVIGLFRRRGF